MAFELIHTFTSLGGITYYLQADFTADLIQTTWDPPASAHEGVLTSGEVGFLQGDVIAYRCVGTTKKTVYADLDFPYMTYERRKNSVDCGWTPPLCTWTATGTAINATNGGNNGSLTISITNDPGTLNFQYSLDGVSWQNSPVFNFLFPGIYQVYVKTPDGCQQTVLVTVGDTITSGQIPRTIPWEETKNLCYFFRLVIDGVTHVIDEPIKWDDVQIIGERDPEFHGYLFKHSDGNVDLGFDCPAGKELIEAVYNTDGQDGDIDFHYGYTYQGIDYYLFRGRLMLNTYKLYPDKVECTVETEDLDTALQSRIDSPVSMMQGQSFDDQPVPVPVPYELELHAKEIQTRFYSDRNGISYTNWSYTQGTRNIFIKPDNTSPVYADLQSNYQYPLGTQTLNPALISEYFVKFSVGGIADITLSFQWEINLRRNNLGDDPDYTAKVYYVKRKYDVSQGAVVETVLDITTTPIVGQFNGNGYLSFTIDGSYSTTNEIFSPGDELYAFCNILGDRESNIRTDSVRQHIGIMDVQFKEISVATNAKGWFLEDVLRHCINVTGNNHYAFRSSFIERINANQVTDGCGSKYFITNGYQIRQFDTTNRPLKISLKKALQGAKAIFCLGMNYANDASGAFIRIERVDFYYQERQILAITGLESYKEEVVIEEVYNEIELGYEKFQTEGYNSLDEFNTKHLLITPIKKNKKKKTELSPFIASGYSVETIRREQFNDTPSSSVENDEEPFIIAVKRVDNTDWETEKDEAFDTVAGIISPETAYNLRISPKRILYNWFIWFKGIFVYKQSTETIKPTQILQNNDLETQFSSSEPCRVGDVDRALIEEKENVPMSALSSTRSIWRPERVTFKCRLNPAQVHTINLAMSGRYGANKDYGYIVVKKPDGEWQGIWLEKISYNYWTEKAEIVGKKMYTTPDVVEDECCPWLMANGCYILVNGDRLIA